MFESRTFAGLNGLSPPRFLTIQEYIRSANESSFWTKAESGGDIVRCLANDTRNDRANNKDAKADSSTSLGLNSVGDSNTKDHATKVSKVPDKESRLTNLPSNISPAVKCGRKGAFREYDKDQSDIVDPTVNTSEKSITKLRTVRQGDEERDDNKACYHPLTANSGFGIHDKCYDSVEHGESGAIAKNNKRKKQSKSPKRRTRELRDRRWQGQKSNGKSSYSLVLYRSHSKKSDNAKGGESSESLEYNIAADNKARVHHGVGVFLVLDTTTGVGKGDRTTDENDSQNDGQTHGKVDDTASLANTTENGNPDEEPNESSPSNSLSDESSTGILYIILNTVGSLVTRDWIDIPDHILVVVLLGASLPGKRALERVSEVNHDPG
ncbi:hypothetical protein HG531_000438 [Fusarium graminearum]|nr:hypothetical protein HG531_000438 [Fusarium graminearum]